MENSSYLLNFSIDPQIPFFFCPKAFGATKFGDQMITALLVQHTPVNEQNEKTLKQ